MPGITLKITISKEVKIVRSGLQNLWRKIPEIGRGNIYDALLKIVKKLRIYPPMRPGQKYIRTYNLRRGWMIRKAGPTAYRLSNPVKYTKYVVGNAFGEGQAWMHVGRWITFRDQVESVLDKLPKTIEENLTMVARRSGLK